MIHGVAIYLELYDDYCTYDTCVMSLPKSVSDKYKIGDGIIVSQVIDTIGNKIRLSNECSLAFEIIDKSNGDYGRNSFTIKKYNHLLEE